MPKKAAKPTETEPGAEPASEADGPGQAKTVAPDLPTAGERALTGEGTTQEQ